MAQPELVAATAAMPQVQDLSESLHDGSVPSSYVLPEPIAELPEDLPVGDVPVVDMSRVASDPDEAGKLKEAFESWGLIHAVGHGIPTALLDAVLEAERRFFGLSREEKHRYFAAGPPGQEGYGNEQVMVDNQIHDWTDRLYLQVHPVDQRKHKFWPDTPANFSDVLSEYAAKTKDLVNTLLVAMARLQPGLDEGNFVAQMGVKPMTMARFNYYPRCSRPELVYGLKPHTDGSALTVVLPDPEVDGLQVLLDGKWFRVPAVPGAVVVNVADQMEIMSNGVYKSPIHRVVTSSCKDRMSVTMFYSADPQQVIGPPEALIGNCRRRIFRDVVVMEYLQHFYKRFSGGERAIDWAKATDPSAVHESSKTSAL